MAGPRGRLHPQLGLPGVLPVSNAAGIVGRWKLVSHGQPIQVGEVTIRRGDFVVSDKDGVLVIPRDITLEVLRLSEELVGTENLVRRAILRGVHPLEAYWEYGRF
jgi:4-hydroxy-4-methyl-2-oxoglutarate aldolase